ncbi:MAG: leucyl aminopeptidase family protein [Phycisphaerales bacterium]
MIRSIKATSRDSKSPDAFVTFLCKGESKSPRNRIQDEGVRGAIESAMKRKSVRGEAGEVTPLFPVDGPMILLVGLGPREKLAAATIRSAAGTLASHLDRSGARRVTVDLGAMPSDDLDGSMAARAFGEGLALAAFLFDDFKQSTRSREDGRDLTVSTGDSGLARAMKRGVELAESANHARRLAATPPNIATTTRIAEEARALAKGSNGALKCSVIDGAALTRHGLVGLINVGKASENPPCLVRLEYTPKSRAKATILLVGKTICYDTGGLSLKISNGMKGMKYDKNGGMAVLGAMHAVSRLKPKVRVVALLPTAENSISDEAYRPDDILEFLNGVSVEVTNTDAEGRLVLADALAYGCKHEKPDAIIDVATLTGGVVVALGHACAGLFCEDDDLRSRIEAAASTSGERVWRLPLFEDYREMMKSQHADIWNSAPVRSAHPIQGAAFLSYFVESGIPWAHIDIAGVSVTDSNRPPFAAGPTGFGVRLLADLLDQW